MRKILPTLMIIFILVLLLSIVGCSSTVGQKGAKPSADWSRSVPVGEGVIGSIGFAVDEKDREIHVAWPADGGKIVYRRNTFTGETLDTSELVFPGQLRMPRLALAGNNQIHLFYSNRLAGGQVWRVWYAILDEDGQLQGEPLQISPAKMNVGDFSIAPDQTGGVLVSWSDRPDGNLYLLHLDAQGHIKSGPHEIASKSEVPTLFTSPDGVVHLSWFSDGSFLYLEIPLDDFGNNLEAEEVFPVVNIRLGISDSLHGPVIGVSEDWVYIFWSILSQSGLEAGTARAYYISFPCGEASLMEEKQLWISPQEDSTYSPYQGSLPLNQLAEPPQAASMSSDFIMRPHAVQEIGSEMVAALVVRQNLRLNNQLQIATVILDRGQYKGYAFASKTQQISDEPVISLDSLGNIFLVWRDGISRENVFYATTNPNSITAIDRLNSIDIVNAVLEGGTESLIGIAFMPFIGFGWLLPGLVVMGIWKLFKDQESVDEPQSWIPLIVSVLIYYTMKIATLPTMMTYVPFSAWLYIPSNWGLVLRIVVPLLIFIIAIIVAHRVRIRYSDSAVTYYLALGLTDAFLTLAIYGVNFLGVF